MFASLLEILSRFYFPILTILASYFFILSLANIYEMWRFSLPSEIFDGPFVSVLIPARNEEENIERCLKTLQNQQYKNYEILVLNDNSEDNTLNIINRISAEDSRVKVFNGEQLPVDWYGKPFAIHQLAKQAKGEILIFTDADTIHKPTSIAWAVTNMVKLKADLVSGYIGQVFGSIGELIAIPSMFCLTGFLISLSINRFFKKISIFSVAIGQFIAIKRTVFDSIGGCETFKKKTCEDMHISRLVKKKGYSTRFLYICDHVECRMFNGYQNATKGIARNFYNFLGNNSIVLFSLTIIIFIFLFLPFPLLFLCIAYASRWTIYIIIIVGLYTLTWIFMFAGMKLKWIYGFLWPLLFFNYIYMVGWSWFRTITGKGFIWKDRKVS